MTNNYNTSMDVASLINARICHDLISPIGAINNGLELMGLSGIPRGPEYELIANSAESANAKINFFRISFGPSSDEMISERDCAQIVGDSYKDHRCQVDWNISTPLKRSEVKLCLLSIQCLETALRTGGKITVTKSTDSLKLSAQGNRIMASPALWDHLLGKHINADLKPADIHFELARHEIEKKQYEITANFGESDISIELSQPDHS